MSGIAGWIARNAPDEGAIAAALDAIAHRGPDGEGACAFQNDSSGHQVVLGQRPSPPVYDEAAGVALVFDGAIYNSRELRAFLKTRSYRFAQESDAEVLLRAYQHWGKDVVQHLHGQFAFALWDAQREQLLLARDRFGEKPLYLCEAGGAVFFASEIKALLRIPGIAPQVDPLAVWSTLAYGYVPGPGTLLKGIRKLPPASYALWQFGRLKQVRYWSLPDRFPRTKTSEADFLATLDESVKLQGADGAFLSGGLDSSAIVALMSRHGGKVSTFSVGLAGARNSELPYAAQVAKHFGTEHHELVVKPDDLIAALPKAVASRDAPLGDPADLALYLLAREAARSAKVVLTGEGADELLGGSFRHVLESLGWAKLSRSDWRERAVRWSGAMDRASRDRLSVLALNGADVVEGMPPFDAQPGNTILRRALYFDQAGRLPDELLERSDRLTAAAGLEARAPFLDHRLAELVSALPDEQRVSGLTTKRVLRKAARGLLPRRLKRATQGLRVPAGAWFRGAMRDYVLDHLRGAGSLTRQYYDGKVLDRLLDGHLEGTKNNERALWTLLNLELWQRTYSRA